MQIKNKGLGRGLDAIFDIDTTALTVKHTASSMEEIAVGLISPNPKQPRTRFDEDALEELADSIKILGVIQPVTLKKESDGRYTLISGERRWRASQLAGLDTIPAYVREADDQAMHEMALVENIQRQDLNAMEVALSLQRLIDECSLTQDALSSRVGKKRSTVANYMRLLKLPAEVQLALREELVTMGHAKAIASLEDPARQVGLLKRIVKKGLSVRQSEELAKSMAEDKPVREPVQEEEFPDSYASLVERLEELFSQEISIKKNRKGGGGKIVIDFASDSDIESFLERINTRN